MGANGNLVQTGTRSHPARFAGTSHSGRILVRIVDFRTTLDKYHLGDLPYRLDKGSIRYLWDNYTSTYPLWWANPKLAHEYSKMSLLPHFGQSFCGYSVVVGVAILHITLIDNPTDTEPPVGNRSPLIDH